MSGVTIRQLNIFKNRFGHLRAGWRIFLYVASVVIFSKLLDLLANSFLLIQGDHLGEYALLWNRFAGKSLQMLAVFLPGIVLLKWLDKRPIALLGIGFYRGTLKELLTGMLLGLILIPLSVSILWLAGVASFLFAGFSSSLLLYLFCALLIFIISAAYEEILFRGYIFQSLIEGSSFCISLGIYSLLFGAAHLSNEGITVFSIAVTVLAGAFLGVLYMKTRALWMCIGVHFIWNWTMGPLFGMGLGDSQFLRKSLFTYQPSQSFLLNGKDVASEIVLGVLLMALTIYLWKAGWLRPAEYNRNLWSRYPAKYGTGPESGTSVPVGPRVRMDYTC